VFHRLKRSFKLFFVFAVALISIIFILEGTVKMLFPLKYKEYVYKYSSEYNLDPYLVFFNYKGGKQFQSQCDLA